MPRSEPLVNRGATRPRSSFVVKLGSELSFPHHTDRLLAAPNLP
jgi:hypothetical protein